MITKDNTRVRAWDQHGREVAPGALDPGPRPDNIITRRVAAAEARRKASRPMIADPNAPPALTAEALTYSASTRCRCGAGLAYPADRAQRSRESWVCSRVLLDNAPQAEHDSFPFAFYELKSEHTVSAYGATTRPPEAPRAAPRPDNIITRRIDAADRRRKATRT